MFLLHLSAIALYPCSNKPPPSLGRLHCIHALINLHHHLDGCQMHRKVKVCGSRHKPVTAKQVNSRNYHNYVMTRMRMEMAETIYARTRMRNIFLPSSISACGFSAGGAERNRCMSLPWVPQISPAITTLDKDRVHFSCYEHVVLMNFILSQTQHQYKNSYNQLLKFF